MLGPLPVPEERRVRVDFYVLGDTPAEQLVPALAAKVLADGHRLLVASREEEHRRLLSQALWSYKPELFLANGLADAPHADRQPVLIGDGTHAINGARMFCNADGVWREGEGFARIFHLFGEEHLVEARNCWRALKERDGLECHYWKRQDGRWAEGG